MTTTAVLPAPLLKGARIGIVTVSAPEPALHPEAFERGLTVLRGHGFEPVLGRGTRGKHGYRAGTESEILEDFHQFIADPSIAAVMSAGGGKSANRLLRGLDFPLITAHPKPVVGVSDPSLLLNAITARTGIPTFHGPAVIWDFGSPDASASTAEHFLRVLSGDSSAALIDAPLTWGRAGTAEGHLVAGCLSSLRCLLGTPFEPRWQGAILAWEDAFKPVDLLDQALTHFRDAGVLDRIAGMVVGELFGCEPAEGIAAREMVMSLCDEYSFPIAFGLPFGHTAVKYTLPIGTDVRISPDVGLTILSPWTTTVGSDQ
ncbi:S66 peptidase family protein [Streptomyces sp. NPDC055103]